jgi:hypothetical protein
LTVGSALVGRPGSITLNADGVSDPDGDVVAVAFYRDANGNGVWDADNDTFESATELGAIRGPVEWQDLTIFGVDDIDVFRFEILPGGDAYRFEADFGYEHAEFFLSL